MNECVFCKIIKGELPADLVYQDNDMVAFRDINPKAPVHILIVPRKHLESVNQATQDDQMTLGKLILVAKKIAEDLKVNGSGYRLSINNGEDAGQAIPHLHMHLLAGRKLLLG